MIYRAQEILMQFNFYTIFVLIILLLIFSSLYNRKFYRHVKAYLWPCIFVWVIIFGYRVETGKNVIDLIAGKSSSQVNMTSEKGPFELLRNKGIEEAEKVKTN